MKLNAQHIPVRYGLNAAKGLTFWCAALCVAVLTAGPANADTPLLIFDPLPKPLVLPPGNEETLPLNHQGSFYGDAIRVVDCGPGTPVAFPGDTPEQEARFGICGNQFFGGDLLLLAHLSGTVRIQFVPIDSTTAHFTISLGVLRGDDSVLAGPEGFRFPMQNNVITDALTLSQGDLDLISGYSTNVQVHILASNGGFTAVDHANPKLGPVTVSYPGSRGHAWARFTQRPDGLLDFYFRGSSFLPLGGDVHGDTTQFPLPFCSADLNCTSIPAPGTSLHPHLYLDTADSLGFTPCGENCPDIPENKVQIFTVNSRYTAFGDDFDLRIPEQGGMGPGRAELQGRFQIQFGSNSGGTVPFRISAMPPEGLFADPPNSPLLGAGFRGFLLGTNQELHFPNMVYYQHKVLFADEVFNFAEGAIDLASGQVMGEFEYPMYIDQSIIEALIPDNNGRVSTEPFFLIGMRPPQDPGDDNYAFFEKGLNGQTMFRANLFHRRSFESYCYPQPSLLPGLCWIGPEGSNLNIFGKLQAAHLADPASPGPAVLSDNRTFVSSIGDTFSYSLSAPCDAAGKQVRFVYTNNNSGPSGGTFTMTHPASVSCTNSKVSTAAPGGYDHIAITGFGDWSKDASGSLPRFMSASISVDPANPFAAIIVYQRYPGEALTLPGAFLLPGDEIDVVLSSAENKPPEKPVP